MKKNSYYLFRHLNSVGEMAFIFSLYVVLFSISSCSLIEEPIGINQKKQNAEEIISLSDGSCLVLSDTITYVINLDDIGITGISVDHQSFPENNLFSDMLDEIGASSSSTVLRAYGYDRQEPETDWKKYYLKGAWEEKYGITPAIYIGRYVKVHKDLSIEKGTYVKPGDYTAPSAPKDVMGWLPNSSTIGFVTSSKNEWIEEGTSRIFILNCDMSGKVYNKIMPTDPSNFLWAYQLVESVDIWQ